MQVLDRRNAHLDTPRRRRDRRPRAARRTGGAPGRVDEQVEVAVVGGQREDLRLAQACARRRRTGTSSSMPRSRAFRPLSTDPPKRSRLAGSVRVADVEILRESRRSAWRHDGHAADDDEVDPAVDQARVRSAVGIGSSVRSSPRARAPASMSTRASLGRVASKLAEALRRRRARAARRMRRLVDPRRLRGAASVELVADGTSAPSKVRTVGLEPGRSRAATADCVVPIRTRKLRFA